MCIEYAKKSNTHFFVSFPSSIEHKNVHHFFGCGGGDKFFVCDIKTKVSPRINSPLFRMIIKTLSNDVIYPDL